MENKKIKILAIDDNRDNLISLKAIISEVIPQSVVYLELSGQGGIESARKNDPDVILLDIVMPVMDGYQVCKTLKADKQLLDTPIIFLTALKGDKQSRILALEAGGEAFIAKPIDATELKAQILAMLKIKDAATFKRDQRSQLEELVQKRTEELKSANIAALNLLEDLNNEIEIRKLREEALKESEKQYAFLAGTAFDLVKFTSIQNIYEYTAFKLYELMDDKGIVAIVEYDTNSNLWKMQHLKGIDDKYADLSKIFGFDIRKLEGEISTKYYEKIVSGKLEEVEIDFPGHFNNKVSDKIGNTVMKLLSVDKMYCISFHASEQIFGNITLVTKRNTKPVNADLIEAFVLQVTNYIKKHKSEEALRMSKELLSETESIGKVGGWSFNIDTKEQKWTDEVYRIHEVEISPEPGIDAGINYYTKESRPIIMKAVQRAIEHGENYDLELEIITAKGNTRAVHTIGKADFKNRRIYGFFQDITERKKADEIKKELLNRLELISLHLPGVIYQFRFRPDGSFHFPYASPGIYNIYGVQPKDVEHDATTAFKAIHPDDLEQVSASINHSAQTLTPWHDIYRAYQPSGKTIWLEGNSTPQKLEDGSIIWHGFIQDITKRKQAEEKLKLLNRAVEASSVSVVITDAEGHINYVNPYFTELTGYSYEEVRGKNTRLLNSGNQPKTFYENLWNTILSGKEWTGEFLNRKKNGELFWENAVISPILNRNGMVTNFVAIKDDITHRKKMLEELVAAKEKAEESDRLKSAFLANMSHEIRTPMNGILGFTELLLEPDLNSEQKETYINIVHQSGQRMLNTVNDIVEISKIEAGIVTVDLKEVDVQERLDELMRFFEHEAMKKGLKIILENEVSKAVALISTDPNKLDSIFTNLIKNAIKYTQAGEIRVGCTVHENRIEFYVKDTGIGIPAERQQAVFERFIKADILDKDARQGSGLGLAITKAYVEMLGGKIWVESEEGIGSTFYFTLPCIAEPQGNGTVNGIPANEAGNMVNPEVSGLKILIVEDDETSGQLISIHVRKFGNEIINVLNGRDAVEACRDNPDIELILMDIQMPEMNGYEATRQIRQFNTNVIIIAITAFALTGDRERAIKAGCNDYISKPVKKDELLALIQKNLK